MLDLYIAEYKVKEIHREIENDCLLQIAKQSKKCTRWQWLKNLGHRIELPKSIRKSPAYEERSVAMEPGCKQ